MQRQAGAGEIGRDRNKFCASQMRHRHGATSSRTTHASSIARQDSRFNADLNFKLLNFSGYKSAGQYGSPLGWSDVVTTVVVGSVRVLACSHILGGGYVLDRL